MKSKQCSTEPNAICALVKELLLQIALNSLLLFDHKLDHTQLALEEGKLPSFQRCECQDRIETINNK
jgi:hypothetical protein